MTRRTLATRNAAWVMAITRRLAADGATPNGVSIASVAFAFVAFAAFVFVPTVSAGVRALLLLTAAASIQLRLLCNLVDGMLAIECGLKSPTGDVYNDVPDRVADVVILVGAGYAIRDLAFGAALGWAAAVTALLTAYVRVLGGALGGPQHFIGPMAKQHRMFVLTIAVLLSVVEIGAGRPAQAMRAGLAVIVAGSVVTACRRTHRILDEAATR